MRPPLSLLLFCTASVVLTTSITAQLSGTYTVDPAGSGARNFKALNEASLALMQGVSGPVTIRVAAGTYQGTWFIPPVPGTSATQRVVLEAATPGSVSITGDATYRRALEFSFATHGKPVKWIVVDGFRFVSSELVGILSENKNHLAIRSIEVRNCRFESGAGISLWGGDHDIHHNEITNGTVGLYGFGHSLHCNRVQNGRIRFEGYSYPSVPTWIYNNLVYQSVAMSLQVTRGFDTVVAHNTFVSSVARSEMADLRSHPLRPVRFYGNIVVNANTVGNYPLLDVGALIPDDVISDGNLFFQGSSQGFIVRQRSTTFATLAAWQNASGEDIHSLVADPRFANATALDYHLLGNSPAIDKAINTPAFVTTDLDGETRDSKPDIGCYEHLAFLLFGKGCPGALLQVPQMGLVGSPTLGSTVSITVGNALASARCFLVFGVSDRTWGSIPLPFPFGGTCNILVSVDLLAMTTVGNTRTASVSLRIPNDTRLRGRRVYLQWAVTDPSAARGLAFSEGARLEVR